MTMVGRGGNRPVRHVRVVDALEGLLAVRARLVVDTVAGAVFGTVVGGVTEIRAILVADVGVELQDQVVELVDVEIVRQRQVAEFA